MVESVTTTLWAIITSLKFTMCLLFLVGITGLYARQVDKAGLLGLAGFVVLILSWWLQSAFVFAEALILPLLAATAPALADALLGISYGHTGGVDLGTLSTLYSVVGIAYLLGGLLFGIATFRAGILPRVPAALLAPIYLRVLFSHAAVTAEFLEQHIELLLDGALTEQARRDGPRGGPRLSTTG